MRLLVSDLLTERGWTAYELAKRSDGRLSLSKCYRLAANEWKCLSADVLEALCDAFNVDPGELLARGHAEGAPKRKRTRKR